MKIAVCMIVKQEAQVIERCFNSFADYISAYIINDNGSTDGTQDLIKSYFTKRGVPGRIHDDAWVDFAHNRSLALQYGRDFIKNELKENPAQWWLLMVDADYTLTIKNPRWVDALTSPSYSFRHSGFFDYTECILFRADKPWKYDCVTHEYPLLPNESSGVNVNPDVIVNHFCDGGSRHDKFERDIRLLTRALKEPTPHKVRYTFYLARSYEDVGDSKNALPYYEERAKMGGFQEEVYYSLYKAGVCKARLATTIEEKMAAVAALMDAYYFRPKRIESLYEAAEFCFNWDLVQLTIPLLKLCISTPYPKNDILMIHREIYDWKALYLYTRATICLDLHEKGLYLHLCQQNKEMPVNYKKFLVEKNG